MDYLKTDDPMKTSSILFCMICLIFSHPIYGVLYNWVAALESCPRGWHLPSDREWKTLELAMGMNPSEIESRAWRNPFSVGSQLKCGHLECSLMLGCEV